MGAAVDLSVSLMQQERGALATQDIMDNSSYFLEYSGRFLRMAQVDDGGCITAGQNYENTAGSSSITFLDYDNDGLPDIFLVNSSQWPGQKKSSRKATPRLYRNLGNGEFADVTSKTGLAFTIYGMGCTFADYDGDGDTDMAVYRPSAGKPSKVEYLKVSPP